MYASDAPVSYPPLLADMTEEQLIAAWEHARDMHQIVSRQYGHCTLQSSQSEVQFRKNQLMVIGAEILRRDPHGIWAPEMTADAPEPRATSNATKVGLIVLAVAVAVPVMAWGIPALIRGMAWLIAWDLSL